MSPQSWLELFSLRDLIDIALVAIVAYNLLLLIRGTRAVQALVGILAIGGVYYVAGAFEVATLRSVIEKIFIALPVVIVVLFQQEIRRALSSFSPSMLPLASRRSTAVKGTSPPSKVTIRCRRPSS